MYELLVGLLNNVWFESFVGHDHDSVPGNVDEECDWETSVECDESLVFEHVLENGEVSLVVEQLTPLFDTVERSHHQIVSHSCQTSPNHKQIRLEFRVLFHHKWFYVFMRRVKGSMSRSTSQRHQTPSLPEIANFRQHVTLVVLIVY